MQTQMKHKKLVVLEEWSLQKRINKRIPRGSQLPLDMDNLEECWNKIGRKYMLQSSQGWPQKRIYFALKIRR